MKNPFPRPHAFPMAIAAALLLPALAAPALGAQSDAGPDTTAGEPPPAAAEDTAAVADAPPGETAAEAEEDGTLPPEEDSWETVTLSLQDLDIRDALAMFSRARRVNIVSGGSVLGRVSIELHDVPFDEALAAVVGAAGFDLARRGEIYYVNKPTDEPEAGEFLKTVRTFRLDYAQVADVQTVIAEMLSPFGKATGYGPLRTLVVEDRPDVLARVDRVIQGLDQAPRQVLIQAQIIEVRMSDDRSFGIDWSLFFSKGKGEGSAELEGFSTLAGSGTDGIFATWGEGDFTTALQSLEDVEELNALASPRLLAIDGKEAHIIIGGQLGFTVITTIENQVIQSVQFLNTGAQLSITPTITSDGYVMMRIHPELSTGAIEEGLPSKTTTEVTTDVLVKDGHTLLIGGLLREREEHTRSGIPYLKNIPVLGMLFGKTTTSLSKSEVITLITPRILEPGETVVE